ncbi:hypothetical protein F4861DRAFT_63639 [Xylaria intraflava]|nr:hypothetical protein F4861DRAFT_63639 [Xylaria intraflava]
MARPALCSFFSLSALASWFHARPPLFPNQNLSHTPPFRPWVSPPARTAYLSTCLCYSHPLPVPIPSHPCPPQCASNRHILALSHLLGPFFCSSSPGLSVAAIRHRLPPPGRSAPGGPWIAIRPCEGVKVPPRPLFLTHPAPASSPAATSEE